MECLGRYRVLDRLASGGMADVLLARTDGIEGFERHVVLKRIREEYARDPQFIRMFLDEARVAANLHHQHIVQVNDVGEANGNYFFAMEYIHGEDVRALLNAAVRMKTHVPLGVVAAIGSAAAAGLHYAHERRTTDRRPLNIVHCDVSPSNILVGYDGSIKVVDFGIAKAALRSEERSGGLKGKASYMSPEQCTGGPMDRRSDVFSLGIVLFELATTTRLFKGTTDADIMDAIVYGRAPMPRTRRPDLPNELAMILMRALEPDPSRRFQTADELRLALDQFAATSNLATSAAAVSTVLKKMFGERPEPWLELAARSPKSSWTELPVATARGSTRTTDSALLALGTDRFGKVYDSQRSFARIDTAPPPSATLDLAPVPQPKQAITQPALKTIRSIDPKKLLRIAAPGAAAVIAAVALAIVALGGDDAPSKTPDAAGVAAAPVKASPAPAARAPIVAPIEAPRPIAQIEPEPAPSRTVARPQKAAPAAVTAPVKPAAAPVAAAVAKQAPAAPATKAPAEIPPAVAAAAEPPPSAPAPEAPAPPPPPPPAPAPAPAIVAMPAPPPVPAAPVIPQLSPSTISRVAWQHSRELAKCEGKDTPKGEVTVRFHVTPDGAVTMPQVATQIRNPKLASCILRVLQRWKFGRQPAGGSQGSYSVVFQ